MPFTFKKTEIPSVILITPRVFNDSRGHFFESFKQSEFVENGISDTFIQDNCSRSTKGVLRGLHFQTNPSAQSKLVRCIQGAIFDVAVDIRRDSPTFGKWVAAELSDENKNMLFIPAGFAHGFYTLSDVAEVTYKVTAEYDPKTERGIMWNDNEIGIKWPSGEALLSDKDLIFPGLNEAEHF